MEIRQFRKKYDLELIPATNSSISLGTLVWDALLGKPKFKHPGMPDSIFLAFLDANLISQIEFSTLENEAKSVVPGAAGLAERIIDVDIQSVNELEHPAIGKLSANFELKNLKKFTFGQLEARVMPGLMRASIDNYLENMRAEKWSDYDGKIRRVFLITELYYGSIKVVIDSTSKTELEAALKTTDLKIKSTTELNKSTEYTFDNNNVPFAMRIEKVSKFNG